MTSPPKTPNNSKRPRLSLQIQPACSPPSRDPRSQSTDPTDPTTFNTMSNVYVTAMDPRFSTDPAPSMTAVHSTKQTSRKTALTRADSSDSASRPAVVTPPSVPTCPCPETPLTAPPTSAPRRDFVYPSTTTATPLSAGALDSASNVFAFSPAGTPSPRSHPPTRSPRENGTPFRRRSSLPFPETSPGRMPYTHPRSLHSILRNSPLPPKPAVPPRRPLLRFQQPAKKVEYDSPLEEEITTFKYTKSHSDLLAEDPSPLSPSDALSAAETPLILEGLSFTADGGQTPGPLEDMRCRMAGLAAASPNQLANRKRRRLEKKRQWVWTIGQDDDDAGVPMETFRRAADGTIDGLEPATPSIESSSSVTDASEVDMSDSCSIVSSEDHYQRRCRSVLSDAEAPGKLVSACMGPGTGDMSMAERTSGQDAPQRAVVV
ncbi:hypothetical protein E4U42_001897 [Claviceps africana]|uniref:Glucan 1, 4-alpha-glucosidase n=1 Tax=Claviceps africana TaxID=83212 RepID=A0A8K0NJ06_9HYPO|nr:hypothetical protein E4U42_001897 [Claviceps africana]